MDKEHIAVIVPVDALKLIDGDPYHLCLAHIVKRSKKYREFFENQIHSYIIMDNGVVETKKPMEIEEILSLGESIGADEVVLPDYIYDCSLTLRSSGKALDHLISQPDAPHTMAVPQGSSPAEWIECVREMIKWDVDCIGLSRFLVPEIFKSRAEALKAVPELIESKKQIHLLGCPVDAKEICQAFTAFPMRIRGVDSGVAAIYAQEGLKIDCGKTKPDVELDFEREVDQASFRLIRINASKWINDVRGVSW